MCQNIDDGFSDGFIIAESNHKKDILIVGDIGPGQTSLVNSIQDHGLLLLIVDDPLVPEILDYKLPERVGLPVTKAQAKRLLPISVNKRKNWMRNHLCSCGSGKKFKVCCWSKKPLDV